MTEIRNCDWKIDPAALRLAFCSVKAVLKGAPKMSVQLALRGSERMSRDAKRGYFTRLFQLMDHSEKEWRARHAREVTRILSLSANAGERGFWRAD
jgi:hypothetical protein